jgi:hypothetical protein
MKKLFLTLVLAAFALISFAQNVPSYVPTNGLVGWWPFNGNANDESGNGNNGTVNGATLATDRFGQINKAYSFDGVNDMIDYIQQPLQRVDSFSISFWMQPKALNQFSTTISLGYDDGVLSSNNNGIQICITGLSSNPATCSNVNGNKLSFIRSGLGCGSTNFIFNDTTTWHNVVVTRKNNQTKYYIDGDSVFSNSLGLNNIITKVRIGSSIGLRFFKGKLDDIGIWNRALTQQEITDLYNGNICYQNITVTDTLLINTGITGFNPITYENTLRVWPNPTNDHITIDAGNLNVLNGYSIRITNSLGQQMFQSAINQQQFYLDLSTWTGNGMYFLNLIDPSGNIIDIKKIVLQ